MYEELIKHLRACEDDYYDCSKCPMMYDEQVEQDLVREHCAAYEAADAIEQLQKELKTAINELCLRCGDYKTAHLGSCDDCRWRGRG